MAAITDLRERHLVINYLRYTIANLTNIYVSEPHSKPFKGIHQSKGSKSGASNLISRSAFRPFLPTPPEAHQSSRREDNISLMPRFSYNTRVLSTVLPSAALLQLPTAHHHFRYLSSLIMSNYVSDFISTV